ncbi:MAG: GNAT family N-acetyltransferase [Lachnospiraceae bacterium]|nr:GNAT family N-acetyltransferase [Lachnospiraceae bacterium]
MVRNATIQDIPGILKLLVQVDMVHHNARPDLFKGPATKYNAQEIAEILQDPEKPIFVFEDTDGTVAGHAFCVWKQVVGDSVLTEIRTLYVDDICVDEAARGRGVGRALYAHVKEYAKAHGFYNITLNVWEGNPGAKAFYEAMGLKPQKIGMEEILEE